MNDLPCLSDHLVVLFSKTVSSPRESRARMENLIVPVDLTFWSASLLTTTVKSMRIVPAPESLALETLALPSHCAMRDSDLTPFRPTAPCGLTADNLRAGKNILIPYGAIGEFPMRGNPEKRGQPVRVALLSNSPMDLQ